MRLSVGLLLVALSVLALVPFVQAASNGSSSSSSGYVTYSVQAAVNGTARAITVTENVTPSSGGQSIVQLAVQGTESNFTYSHVVNSSLTLFPYLPSISNESYTYSNDSYTVKASITQQGTSQVTFQGESYTLTDYAFSATVTSPNGTRTVTGSLAAFPSDLVYSASAQGEDSNVAATLTATSLPLTGTSATPAVQAASAGVGISLAVGAVALSLGVKMRSKSRPPEAKPDHWVD